MKYKLIVSDFDGTLNWYHDIVGQRLRTIDAISAFRAKGGIFTLNTGRSYESLEDSLKLYQLDKVDVPVGCYNGAAIYSSATGKLVAQYSIPNDLAIRWIKHASQWEVYIQCYVDKNIYIENTTKFTEIYCRGTKLNFVEVGDLVSFLKHTGYTPKKLLIMGMPDKILEIDYLYNNLYKSDFLDLTFMQSHDMLYEIISSKASKGNAVQEIAGMLDVDLSNIVCIGDNINDVSMLQVAGLGVAVENAKDEVKAVARHHTLHCTEGGVAKTIEDVVADLLP